MSLTGTDYRRYDPKRVCDVCGHLWHKSELTRIAPFRWACPDDAKGLTAEDISRHNASVRPLMVRAVKNAKGLSQTPTYQQAEGAIFNLIVDKAPDFLFLAENGTAVGASQTAVTGVDGARAVGWMAFYLGNLVLENLRPRRWIEQATVKLASLADRILAFQFSDTWASPPTQTPLATTAVPFGGVFMGSVGAFNLTISIDCVGTAACMLALLRAYRVFGATKYLVAARRCATFLRRAQCVGNYNVVPARRTGGGFMLPGPLPETIRVVLNTGSNGAVGSYIFRPTSLVTAWAMNELLAVDGDATYGSGGGAFGVDCGQTLSGAIADNLSFWANGDFDGSASTKTVGFGPDTPKDSYRVTTSSSSTWQTNAGLRGQIIRGFEYALGIRSLYAIGGYTAQVAALYTWLRSFSADPLNAAPSNDDQKERSTLGIYDPTLALARYLQVTDATGAAVATEAPDVTVGSQAAPGYDWRTVGVLAPLQSARASSELRAAKDAMSAPRRRRWNLRGAASAASNLSAATYDRVDYIGDDLRLLTFSGLSLQTSVGMSRPDWSASLAHYADLEGAAIAADAYRYPPGAFPLEQG